MTPDPLNFPCSRCHALAGVRCKNYKGQNKPTCKGRGDAPTIDEARPAPTPRAGLFDDLEDRPVAAGGN